MTDTNAPKDINHPIREKLQNRYDSMWHDAIGKIRDGKMDIDPVLASGNADARRGMTLIARPSDGVREGVGKFLEELRRIEPSQYYYPPDDLHITILAFFSATTAPEPFLANADEYVAATQAVLAGGKPIQIEFTGITASPNAILIQGFVENSELNDLRDRLRKELHRRDLGGTVDKRYTLETAHMTVARFRAPLVNGASFAGKLENFRNNAFGISTIRELSVVKNDWYMSSGTLELIKGAPLAIPRSSRPES